MSNCLITKPTESAFVTTIRAVRHSIAATVERLYSGVSHLDLAIFDNNIPDMRTPYRHLEFNAYFQYWDDSLLFSSLATRSGYSQHLSRYCREYPAYGGRIKRFNPKRRVISKMAYMLFLSNVIKFRETIERNRLPYVFTLYPGGGLLLHDKLSDLQLKLSFESKHFRKVIVTQPITYNYLIDNNFCTIDDIVYIYGGMVSFPVVQCKRRYTVDKDTFDICFVAHKYMIGGYDKGYDLFIDAARQLAKIYPQLRFHVVGGFNSQELDINDIEDRVFFHGVQTVGFFTKFYQSVDIIISPNRAFTLRPGAFDGFPTASCVEAMLGGVLCICTDPLDQNTEFTQNIDIDLIEPTVECIISRVEHYLVDLDDLERVSSGGQRTAQILFDPNKQLQPRLELLSKLIS